MRLTIICDALCSTGRYDSAYKLLMQQEKPSWFYPVTMGASTIWERWDSMLPDGSINPGEMTSFNHYALCAFADWMHRTIDGLTFVEAGYRCMKIAPRPGGGLSNAKACHCTLYGQAEAFWKIEANNFILDAVIPPNTTTEVILPGRDAPIEVGSGSWHWSVPYQDPDAHGSFTVDDLIGDILYDTRARNTIVNTFKKIGAPDFMLGMVFSERNLTLREGLGVFPNPEAAIEIFTEALADSQDKLDRCNL